MRSESEIGKEESGGSVRERERPNRERERERSEMERWGDGVWRRGERSGDNRRR
jgi:hypothetical protein